MAKLDRQDLRLMAHTEAHRVGGDPSLLLDLLADALIDEQWRKYTDDNDMPFESEYDFLTRDYPEGIGLDPSSLSQLSYARHRNEILDSGLKKRMSELRNKLGSLYGNGVQPVHPKGGDMKSNLSDISDRNDGLSKTGGTSKPYRIAVLKRDAPDLAEKVISGELSAAAGMRELRVRNGEPEYLRRAVNMTDAQSAFDTLTKFMPDDVLHELIDLLNDWNKD